MRRKREKIWEEKEKNLSEKFEKKERKFWEEKEKNLSEKFEKKQRKFWEKKRAEKMRVRRKWDSRERERGAENEEQRKEKKILRYFEAT